MIIVSTQEFNASQEKYFDMALNDHVIIQRGTNLFIVQSFVSDDKPDEIFEPDDDFYKSIPLEEVRDKIVGYIHKKHAT